MKFFSFLVLSLMIITSNAHAKSELKIQGDLMIHPAQIAKFFEIATGHISSVSSWDWPQMSFVKPYRTAWTEVAAKGPFNVRFETADLQKQEVGFELDWIEPVVNVGRFEIHDTLSRQIGGANIIIHLDGACNNMVIRVPNGQWKVKGMLRWTWSNQGMIVSWKDFQFAMNDAAQATVDLGQCEGPQGIHQELRTAIETVSRDHAWMQDVLKEGVLEWVSGSMGKLQTELLKVRQVDVKPGLAMSWQPEELSDVGQGVIRVAGQILVVKDGVGEYTQTLERSYDLPSLGLVKESGFVLPKDTLQALVNFMHKNGELGYRANSKDIDSFKGLMSSRFMQFFVWPDLMSFSKSTQFYFDVSSEKAPVLSNGVMLKNGGIQYAVQAPLIVNQWAPTKDKYVPYVDFRSPLKGNLSAKINKGKFVLQLNPGQMNVTSGFRREFSLFRRVNTWIATSLLGSRVASYLQSKPFQFEVPEWEVGDGLELSMRDVQVWKQSFRIPLEFKKSK